jgi:hypothetical protein
MGELSLIRQGGLENLVDSRGDTRVSSGQLEKVQQDCPEITEIELWVLAAGDLYQPLLDQREAAFEAFREAAVFSGGAHQHRAVITVIEASWQCDGVAQQARVHVVFTPERRVGTPAVQDVTAAQMAAFSPLAPVVRMHRGSATAPKRSYRTVYRSRDVRLDRRDRPDRLLFQYAGPGDGERAGRCASSRDYLGRLSRPFLGAGCSLHVRGPILIRAPGGECRAHEHL